MGGFTRCGTICAIQKTWKTFIVFTCFQIVQIVPNRVKCFMSLPFYYVLYSEMKLKNELPAANLAKIKKKKKKCVESNVRLGFNLCAIYNIHDQLIYLSLKCKISTIWLVEAAWIFLIFLFATMQISMGCEAKEN